MIINKGEVKAIKLAGKVAVVTGSSQGIGKAIALRLASEGAKVVVTTSTSIERAQQVVDEIGKLGGNAMAYKVDVAKRAEVKGLVDSTLKNFGAIHILVNNAGITRNAPLIEISEEDWDAVINVCLKGAFNCTQAVLGHMMKHRYGKIINISSVIGIGSTMPFSANYGAAKAGIVQLTKVTALEAGPYGINVNAIAPGTVITNMTYTRRSEEEVQKFIDDRAKRAFLGRVGQPEDIANLALFLASDEASFITGQAIACDGGRHDRM